MGCGQRGVVSNVSLCRVLGTPPRVPELLDCLAVTVPKGTHHKDPTGRSTRVALGLRGADGLEVIGLLACVEGVVVEG